MFVWAKIPASFEDGYKLSDDVLYNANVFITPGGIFGSNGDGYIRVSLCAPVEKFEEAIERIKAKRSKEEKRKRLEDKGYNSFSSPSLL
jgi:LL-diaminopimelate aminotransferase